MDQGVGKTGVRVLNKGEKKKDKEEKTRMGQLYLRAI